MMPLANQIYHLAAILNLRVRQEINMETYGGTIEFFCTIRHDLLMIYSIHTERCIINGCMDGVSNLNG